MLHTLASIGPLKLPQHLHSFPCLQRYLVFICKWGKPMQVLAWWHRTQEIPGALYFHARSHEAKASKLGLLLTCTSCKSMGHCRLLNGDMEHRRLPRSCVPSLHPGPVMHMEAQVNAGHHMEVWGTGVNPASMPFFSASCRDPCLCTKHRSLWVLARRHGVVWYLGNT